MYSFRPIILGIYFFLQEKLKILILWDGGIKKLKYLYNIYYRTEELYSRTGAVVCSGAGELSSPVVVLISARAVGDPIYYNGRTRQMQIHPVSRTRPSHVRQPYYILHHTRARHVDRSPAPLRLPFYRTSSCSAFDLRSKATHTRTCGRHAAVAVDGSVYPWRALHKTLLRHVALFIIVVLLQHQKAFYILE